MRNFNKLHQIPWKFRHLRSYVALHTNIKSSTGPQLQFNVPETEFKRILNTVYCLVYYSRLQISLTATPGMWNSWTTSSMFYAARLLKCARCAVPMSIYSEFKMYVKQLLAYRCIIFQSNRVERCCNEIHICVCLWESAVTTNISSA
jgi:hypothetical protein